ncbi:sugar ABC transporter ATP-binding protein [Microbacterium sp. B24]|uniref:sugar ABC transporter ATP-binding protein n=1 Tax=Microbacterium sp. B24 TaxID=95616 RepID=UPI0004029EDE|nr:sugar ABC transporter ATP-binding protein [Microbacterium sp. B24]
MTDSILEVRNIGKTFPGVRALDDVSFTLRKGEVLTLAGENGAGKSTLLGILGGALAPDRGSITVDGVRRGEYSPRRALADGVVIAHQEPAVVPQLTVEQNLLLGKSAAERRTSRDAVAQALADVASMGFPLNPRSPLRRLSPAQRHALTIAKAFAFGAKIVALDEPTTSMLEHNVDAVLSRVRELAHDKGTGVIFVSHKMPEVMKVSDTVVVLRDGRIGYRSPISETSVDEIVRSMVGRELLDFRRAHPVARDAEVLFTADEVGRPDSDARNSIAVHRGEVVGIAGLVGSGRTEFLRAIFRADPGCTGRISIAGRALRLRSPNDSRRAGIAFIPEDRKKQGLVLQVPAYANVALTAADAIVGRGPFFGPRRAVRVADELGTSLDLRPKNVRLLARQFSGGNQQKIVIAKWLRRDSRVFLFDEPTKGVDVGGKAEIYGLIDKLAAEGNAIIVVSSDLPEIIALADRALVMRGGRFVSEHVGGDITEQSLVASAMGITEETS